MATVIGIFEDLYEKNKPLTVVKPGNQTRRFTHIQDTIGVCYDAWVKNKNAHYSISHKRAYTIKEVANMFNTKIKYIPPSISIERKISGKVSSRLAKPRITKKV